MDRAPRFPVTALLLLLAASPSAATDGPAVDHEHDGLRVAEIVVCRGIDRAARTPLEPGVTFPAGLDRLYCFTRLTGAVSDTTVTHVWFHEGAPRAHVDLAVRSSNWRTWSSKALLPAWIGDWEVRVLDADGLVLGSRRFTVTDASEPEEGS